MMRCAYLLLLVISTANLFGETLCDNIQLQDGFCGPERPSVVSLQSKRLTYEQPLVLGCQGRQEQRRFWSIPKENQTEISQQFVSAPFFGNHAAITLEINKARRSGHYYCANENALGQRYFLQDLKPDRSTKRRLILEDIVALRGEHVVLPFFTRLSEKNISLYKETQNVNSKARVSRDAKTGFTISNVQSEDEGVYKCDEGQDMDGSPVTYLWKVSLSGITARTTPKPRMVITSTSVDTVSITCEVHLEPRDKDSIQISERLKGESATFKAYNSRSEERSGSFIKKSVTWILPRQESTSGKYVCMTTDVTGRLKSRYTSRFVCLKELFPAPPEVSINNMSNYSLVLSRFASERELLCTACGEPKPTIQWLKNGFQISHENVYDIFASGGVMTTMSGLTIYPSGQPADGGADEYICIASNSEGERSASVSVSWTMGAPKYVIQRKEPPTTLFNTYYAKRFPEKYVTMTVSMTSVAEDETGEEMPPVEILWTRRRSPTLYEMVPEMNSTKYGIAKYGLDSYNITSGLTVKVTTFSDAGEYFATVIVSGEVIKTSFSLQVFGLWSDEPRLQSPSNSTECYSYGIHAPKMLWKFTPCSSAPPNGCQQTQSHVIDHLKYVQTNECAKQKIAAMPNDVQCEVSTLLNISHIRTGNSGLLKCFLEGHENDGITFDVAEIDLDMGENFIRERTNYISTFRTRYIVIDRTFELYCVIPFFFVEPNATFSWERDETTIIKAGYNDVSDSKYKKSILVVNAGTWDLGKYFCKIKVSHPEHVEMKTRIWASPFLGPLVPRIFAHNLNGDIRVVYAFVTLQCAASGFPPPVIEWRRDGQLYSTNVTRSMIGETRVVSEILATLTRNNGTNEYSCTAINFLGEDKESIILQASEAPGPPEFVSENLQNTTRIIPLKGNNHLKCFARGYPRPSIQWRRNNEEYADSLSDSWGHSYTVFSVISAQPSGTSPFDVFSCTAFSPAGNITAYVNLLFEKASDCEGG